MKKIAFAALSASALLLSACASTQSSTQTPITTLPTADTPLKFAITGKIGVVTATPKGRQAGSAFYAWAQEDNRFSIDLTGALGIGATQIRYNGTTATLDSERTGTMTADTPEALLLTATGWQAPISQLPHWILGRSAPDDSVADYDSSGRLVHAANGAWRAQFDYDKSALPSRLRITHTDQHSVTMTMVHQ
ncbi:lipoprotein insertase outer membrane protein LolB [Moraxella canis]|uniref:Outer-membrane lipoprotein LolB n=1 Tax=Moraxella canis TaxID=90239 RepID=A0ABZ0WVP1_9GAMM|nr:lipoprotein insertase outer membrane protein LolB [Moraxella canis]WQE03312.1 lipoprotein insertase outer membrane protein LolB [Moraxella canis]